MSLTGTKKEGVIKTYNMGDWTLKNSCYLTLMTSAYIIGEIAHFLINTTGREVGESFILGTNLDFYHL